MVAQLFMTLFLFTIFAKALLEFLTESVQLKQIITPIFIFCVLAYQIGMVMASSKESCGKIQLQDVLIYGLGYWIMIFGSTILLITMFPGWKQPFSNFFGYGIVNLMGIKYILNRILLPKDRSKDPKLNSIIERIYEDHSLLINSFTPDNFNSAMKGLKGIFRPEIRATIEGLPSESIDKTFKMGKLLKQRGGNIETDSPSELIKKLANLVMLKDKIAENIWFATSGWLSLTYSSMLTTSAKCNLSPAKLKKHIQDYQSHLEAKEQKQKADDKKKGVLTITD